MEYIVYKLVRNDGEIYIGTTNTKRFKNRMNAHKVSPRFKGYSFDIEILHKNKNEELIDVLEEYYINLFNSYNNGLNESINGKGNHLSQNFNTRRFKYSKESKKLMSISAKKRIERDGVNFKGCKHTKEAKEKMSKKRKGIIWKPPKLNYEKVNEIRDFFNLKPYIENIGEIQRNGKILTYERAFAKKFHKKYKITSIALYNVITRRTWNGAVFFTK